MNDLLIDGDALSRPDREDGLPARTQDRETFPSVCNKTHAMSSSSPVVIRERSPGSSHESPDAPGGLSPGIFSISMRLFKES